MTPFSFDFETALVEPGLPVPPPVCLSLCQRGFELDPDQSARVETPSGVGFVLLPDPGIDQLEAAIDRGDLIVGLNTAYDLAVACEHRPSILPKVISAYDADRVTDVSIRQKLIDIAMGYDAFGRYGMQALAKRLLHRHIEKEDTWRLRYWELSHLPLSAYPQDAIQYSGEDGITTLEIWEVQENDLAEIDRLAVLADQYRQSRADFALHAISSWGLRTDREGCEWLEARCREVIDRLEAELLRHGLLRHKYKGRGEEKHIVGVTKTKKAVQERILAASGGDWAKLKITDKGADLKSKGLDWQRIEYLATDEEACSDSDDPVLEKYTEYSQMSNMLTGYVKAVKEGIDVPIHTHFEVLLVTGRTSSSNPNVQNVRKLEGAREVFIPRPGHCFIACDIDRAELHTLAQVCINLFGASALADTLNAGIDPHTRFGARLAGCSYSELEQRIEAGDDTAIALRQRAKPANFGFPGGMGPAGMQRYAKGMYGIILSSQEAFELHEGWKEEYPIVSGKYLPWIGQLVRGKGSGTIQHFGSERWRGGAKYCAAANSFFQGMAADALKAALWALLKKCLLPGTPLYGCHMVNEIHDEGLLEAPLDRASDAAHEMQRTMIESYNTYTKDVPVKAKPALMDRWSKKAKTMLVEGTYQVWHYERKA